MLSLAGRFGRGLGASLRGLLPIYHAGVFGWLPNGVSSPLRSGIVLFKYLPCRFFLPTARHRLPLFPRIAATAMLVAVLAGCQAGPESAALDALRQALFRSAPSEPALNPAFSYLRVTLRGNVAYLALGSIDPHPQGDTETWYSASGEVLRLREGRIAELLGTVVEWRDMRMTGWPGWNAAVAAGANGVDWSRYRDVMPGYRYQVHDQLQLRPVAPPTGTLLQRVPPSSLRWFEERRVGASRDNVEALPPARFALEVVEGRARVVYGEQCLRADFCLTWQRWAVVR